MSFGTPIIGATTSCSTYTPYTDTATIIGIKWDLIEVVNRDGESITDFDRATPYIVFSEDRKLSGYTLCNSFAVSYIFGEDQKLTVYRDFMMTTLACLDEELEQTIVHALRSCSSYKIVENELHLLDRDLVILKFTKS